MTDHAAHLSAIIEQMSERSFPSEEQLAKREAYREKAKLETNKIVYLDAYLKHLPAELRRQAQQEPSDIPGNQEAKGIAARLEFGMNLFVFGPPGVGKTHLAVWTVARMIRALGVAARVWTFPALMQRYRNAAGNTEDQPDIISPAVLLVDDVDKAYNSAFTSERLYELLERTNAKKTTIMTSNHHPAVTAKLFYKDDAENQAAIGSRLAAFEVVRIGGKDHRRA